MGDVLTSLKNGRRRRERKDERKRPRKGGGRNVGAGGAKVRNSNLPGRARGEVGGKDRRPTME